MKSLILLLIYFLSVIQVTTGQNQWSWMNGDKSPNVKSNYGTLGVALSSNNPGSRIGAVTWTDKDGNLWLFGGNGKGESSRSGYLNDLWKFNPSSYLWTWMGGNRSTNNTGNYNSKGTPSVNNIPGARQNAVGWTDSQGNFWLFGGEGIIVKKEKKDDPPPTGGNNGGGNNDGGGGNNGGGNGNGGNNNNEGNSGKDKDKDNNGSGNSGHGNGQGNGNEGNGRGNHAELESADEGLLNDLWMYSPATGEWTWVSGNDKANEKGKYGTLLQPSDSNFPGARTLATSWTDLNGNFWLFGGRGYSSKSSISDLNDVWKFSPGNREWVWMKGSNSDNTDAHFGEKGVFTDENTPGGRRGSTSWTDNEGSFWMFGGGSQSDLNSDMWKYNSQSNRWAWISGSKNADQAPVYKSQNVPDLDGNPGSRIMASGWVDDGGNLWLFGGAGYGKQTGTNAINNLWKYSVTSNEWTFIKGDISVSPVAVYGTKGELSNANNPGGTVNYSRWKDNQGNFWLFGGQSSNGFLNQTWKFAACVTEITGSISPAEVSICGGVAQKLTATGGTSYTWLLDGVVIDGETAATLTVSKPGTYSVVVSNGGCSSVATNTAIVSSSGNSAAGIRYTDVSATANVPVQLKAREIGVAYEWKPSIDLNNPSSVIPTVTTASERQYTVSITTEQGCIITDTVLVKINGDKKIFVPTAFTPNSNGVNDKLRPLGNLSSIEYFRVFNRWGSMLFQTNESGAGWDGKYKGIDQPSDTYTWMLSGKSADGESLKISGKTFLIR